MNTIQRRFIQTAINLQESVVDFDQTDEEFIEQWEVNKERFKEMLRELEERINIK